MVVTCCNNEGKDTLTIGKEYSVYEEGSEYFIVIDDNNEKLICKKSIFLRNDNRNRR